MRIASARLLILVAVSGCSSAHNDDVVGPFTGVTHRYIVDQVTLPPDRLTYAEDLAGDGRARNQLGVITGGLSGENMLDGHVADMLASGALASILEITTDDAALENDPTVGVRFYGRDGDPADVMGATLVKGVLESNRDADTHHPASGIVRLPLFRNADPVRLPSIGLEVDLTRDADGKGWSGALHGAFVYSDATTPAYQALSDMVNAQPYDFPSTIPALDTDRDGVITEAEFLGNDIVKSLLSPDVVLTDGHGGWKPDPTAMRTKDSISFGFAFHASACDAGDCRAAAAATCYDRVLDGGESDVDCGGSCGGCVAGGKCAVDHDCLSLKCENGQCAAPTCSDGVRDGFETGVDCGTNCAACASGVECFTDADCQSGQCNGGGATLACQ
jgi:hypothetical protein